MTGRDESQTDRRDGGAGGRASARTTTARSAVATAAGACVAACAAAATRSPARADERLFVVFGPVAIVVDAVSANLHEGGGRQSVDVALESVAVGPADFDPDLLAGTEAHAAGVAEGVVGDAVVDTTAAAGARVAARSTGAATTATRRQAVEIDPVRCAHLGASRAKGSEVGLALAGRARASASAASGIAACTRVTADSTVTARSPGGIGAGEVDAVGIADPVAGLAVGGDARIAEVLVVLAALGSTCVAARSSVTTRAASRIRADQLGVVVGVASPFGGLAVRVGAGVVVVRVLVAVGVATVAARARIATTVASPAVGVVASAVASGFAAPGVFGTGAAGVGEGVVAADHSGCCESCPEEKASGLLKHVFHVDPFRPRASN